MAQRPAKIPRMTITTRFAPSPTGRIHLGNARTAYFNYLAARQAGGKFLLRVEDTDLERSRDDYITAVMDDLSWLGVTWDEGPDVGGPQSPYRQSQRGDIYRRYYQALDDQGLVYPCYCSAAELALSRKAQRSAGQAPRYAGACAHLSAADRSRREAKGITPTLRFRVAPGCVIEFEDRVRGRQRFLSDDIGDFIIRKADGTPAFFFCNAIDDALMGVNLVLRGEDHLTNTPRQLLLLAALGLPTPAYGHISLVLGQDGAPLAKRNGSRSIAELRAAGWLPEAVANYLARLGHTFAAECGLLAAPEIAEAFRLPRLVKAAARYDEGQLAYWQKAAVSTADEATLSPLIQAQIAQPAPAAQWAEFIRAIRDNIVLPGDAALWADVVFSDAPPQSQAAAQVLADADVAVLQAGLECIDPPLDWATFSKAVGARAGVKGKALFQPLRAALTGQLHGPQMADLLPLIGESRARARLAAAVDAAAGRPTVA